MLVAALAALDPQESMLEPSAARVRIELGAHEPGQRGASLGEILEKRLGVLLDHLVEHCVFRPVAGVVLLRRRDDGEGPLRWG